MLTVLLEEKPLCSILVRKEEHRKQSQERLTRLANQNFGETDMHVVLTYRGDAPDEEQAGRDVRNYLRRVRRWRRARGMPDIKYIYVTECTGKNGETKRIHHHIMMSGMPRDEAEALWRMGRANARRLQPDERGLEALICYMVKAKKCRAQTSRNLMPPVERVRDIRLGWRKAARIAEAMEAGGAGEPGGCACCGTGWKGGRNEENEDGYCDDANGDADIERRF